MNEKIAESVDEAIEQVADQAGEGLEEVKESLAKAQRSMESAKAAIQGAAGKARETGAVAAEKAPRYLSRRGPREDGRNGGQDPRAGRSALRQDQGPV